MVFFSLIAAIIIRLLLVAIILKAFQNNKQIVNPFNPSFGLSVCFILIFFLIYGDYSFVLNIWSVCFALLIWWYLNQIFQPLSKSIFCSPSWLQRPKLPVKKLALLSRSPVTARSGSPCISSSTRPKSSFPTTIRKLFGGVQFCVSPLSWKHFDSLPLKFS